MYFWEMQLKAYIKYRRARVNAHGIHSPFVFEFYEQVVKQAYRVEDSRITAYHKKLRADRRVLPVVDFGAGSRIHKKTHRTVSEIARTAAINGKFGKLLSRMIEYYKLQQVVELGTSLGMGTLYLSQPQCVKKVVTAEGSPEIAAIARETFALFNRDQIQLKVGKFDALLESIADEMPAMDLVYIDGNHQYQATLDYFHFFLEHTGDAAFLVFDDINWSEGMQRAWQEICASDKIHVSIDLFRMGIVCKRKAQAKEHFVLKY